MFFRYEIKIGFVKTKERFTYIDFTFFENCKASQECKLVKRPDLLAGSSLFQAFRFFQINGDFNENILSNIPIVINTNNKKLETEIRKIIETYSVDFWNFIDF